MGWTSYYADVKYRNGRPYIDRKAECDKLFNWDAKNESGEITKNVRVLKSRMVGSTYYAAVKTTDIADESKNETIGMVVLTSTNMRDEFNFYYKDISENMGPCESRCPESILSLLPPTKNEYAIAWRDRCHKYNHDKKMK